MRRPHTRAIVLIWRPQPFESRRVGKVQCNIQAVSLSEPVSALELISSLLNLEMNRFFQEFSNWEHCNTM